jgi:hypothetical protein
MGSSRSWKTRPSVDSRRAIIRVSTLPPQELGDRRCLAEPPTTKRHVWDTLPAVETAPKAMRWREDGSVTPMRPQLPDRASPRSLGSSLERGYYCQVDLAMKHPISPDNHNILDDLDVLRAEARPFLEVASLAARAEWEKFESRFPSTREIWDGFIALSNPELHEVRANAQRFRDILSRQPGGSRPIGRL